MKAESEMRGAPDAVTPVSLDGRSVMFIGNSFTYYGGCVEKSTFDMPDTGYFYRVAQSFGDRVRVTNFTVGGASLRHSATGATAKKPLYDMLLARHPAYFGNPGGAQPDPVYRQDYVILQQSGDNISLTLDDARAVMALFSPQTKFCFYITTHDISAGHAPTVAAAEALRDGAGVIYIPLGELLHAVWTGAEAVDGCGLIYNKNTFIVDWTDRHHPNYLTGYLTALMTYCAITGRPAAGADCSFVSRDNVTYYTNGVSDFPSVLDSAADMAALGALVDRYTAEYNGIHSRQTDNIPSTGEYYK